MPNTRKTNYVLTFDNVIKLVPSQNKNSKMINSKLSTGINDKSKTITENNINKPDVTDIFDAIGRNLTKTLEKLILDGADVNSVNNDKIPALIYACQLNRYDIVKVMVENNAKLELIDNSGNTALMISIQNKNTIIAEYLLRHGAKPNCINKNNFTPLIIAIKRDLVDFIQPLIDKGADVRLNDPLMIALQQSNVHSKKIVEILKYNGVRHQIKDNYKYTGSQKVNFYKNTLITASKNGNLKIIDLAIDDTEDVNQQDEARMTAIMHIIHHLEDENDIILIIEKLLARGANLHIKNSIGQTALDIAERKDLRLVVKYLKEEMDPLPRKQPYIIKRVPSYFRLDDYAK